ncbi:MAG: phosphodiester glycosidase family protein [Thermacetogeniaceae bacterium]
MPVSNSSNLARTARPGRTARKKANAKKILLAILLFLGANILFFAVTCPLVVWYGPFRNIKNAALGAIATSQHQYLLRYIMSPWEISKLLSKEPQTGGGVFGVTIGKNHDNGVTLTEVNSSRFKGYLLEINDPTRVKLGVTASLGVKGELTSEIARDNGAMAAVNAGGFDDPAGTGNGRTPYGIIIHNGFILAGADTQGKVELIGLDDNGILFTGYYTIREIRQLNIKDAISFGPTLIKNGQKQITRGDGGWGIAPRTAIGQKQDGAIMLLVIDGRQTDSLGASLLDVQNILYDNGAWTAANLDGGSSTTMYYEGKVVNHPCDLMGERLVPTAFIVI